MKLENFRAGRKRNALTSALLSNLLYFVLVIILKEITNAVSGDGYNVVFGFVQLALVCIYWIGINYFFFKDTIEENRRSYITYLIASMVPMLIFMLITFALMIKGLNGGFALTWNALTFAVAPTLFVFLPYGVIYHFVGNMIPIVVFFIICFVLMAGLQVVGYAAGTKSRRRALARRKKRQMLEEKRIAEQKQKAQQAQEQMQRGSAEASRIVRQQVRRRNVKPKKKITRDPFADIEQPAVVETEAFTPITDEEIERVTRELEKEKKERAQAERKKKREEAQARAAAAKASREKAAEDKAAAKAERKKTSSGKGSSDGPNWVIPDSQKHEQSSEESENKPKKSRWVSVKPKNRRKK